MSVKLTQSQVPYTESQRSTQVSDVSTDATSSGSMNKDLLVNNLKYVQPKALSLSTQRTYRRQQFQTSTYTAASRADTATCIWNSGHCFVDPANSYLKFSVEAIGANATFGSGSAVNCISEIRLKSRSGAELDRILNVNLWSAYDSRFNRSQENINTLGSNEGFSVTLVAATPKQFCIPLACLSGFFRPYKKQLIPPMLASGMLVEIVWEDFRTALTSAGATTSYNITGLEFQLDCVTLADQAIKALSYESAENGLEYSYPRVHCATQQIAAGITSLTQQITKAVSQAQYVMSITRLPSAVLANDSFASKTFDFTSWQYKIGNLYYPGSVINMTAGEQAETYQIVQQVFEKMRYNHSPGSVTPATFLSTYGMLASSFEKNQDMHFSAIPINNSRSLELTAEFGAMGAIHNVFTFLQYASVARCFIDNVSVAV